MFAFWLAIVLLFHGVEGLVRRHDAVFAHLGNAIKGIRAFGVYEYVFIHACLPPAQQFWH